jgi:hypothetical protein
MPSLLNTLLLTLLLSVSSVVSSGVPQCALDCEGLTQTQWENSAQACSYFSKYGYECLSDCSEKDLNMNGITYEDIPLQCSWINLGCDELGKNITNTHSKVNSGNK